MAADFVGATIGAALAWGALAGALGSGHCLWMCGPFATGALARRPGAVGAPWRRAMLYQIGRLTAYVGIGIAAGVVGDGLLRWASEHQLQRGLAWLLGAMMIAAGVATWRPGRGGRLGRAWARVGAAIAAVGRDAGPRLGPYLLGLAATLLPCGLLHGYALAAAATGSLDVAIAVMLGAWAGSLPALALTAPLLRLAQTQLAWGRRALAAAFVIAGLVAIVGRGGAGHDHGAAEVCAPAGGAVGAR